MRTKYFKQKSFTYSNRYNTNIQDELDNKANKVKFIVNKNSLTKPLPSVQISEKETILKFPIANQGW